METDDFELITRTIIDEDHSAFAELVNRHQSAVRNFLRHLTHGNAALADDLAQETFVQAYRSLSRFRGEAGFSTWLLGIAHNHWRNARRKQHEHSELDYQAETEIAVESTARSSDLKHDLAEALRTLSDDEQLVLHLGYQQGLSHGEISVFLDWPLGTVKTHLARSKEKLRHLLATWNPQT